MRKSLKIAYLMNNHEGDYVKCPGCETCKKIRQLSKITEKIERYKHILDKGEGMTTKDLLFLLDKGVQKAHIQKALGLNKYEFSETLGDLGIAVHYVSKKDSVDMDEVIKLRGQQLTWKEISKRVGMSDLTLRKARKKWGI